MAPFRLVEPPFRSAFKTQLDSLVAVARFGLDLGHRARAEFHDGATCHAAVGGDELYHAELLTKLKLDLDVDAAGELESHERIHGLT